jgi:hypothetical protein
MDTNTSFVLNPNEAIIDEVKVIYEGKSLLFDTFSYGIVKTIGFIQSTTRQREEFLEKCYCNLILTNQRIVFIQVIERLGKDAKLGPLYSSIPLNLIDSIHTKSKLVKGGFYLILSINSKPHNNEVRIDFLDDKEFRKKPKNQQQPEYWVKLIGNSIRNSLQQVSPSVTIDQDPLKILQDPIKILKMRFAKGEISEDEYIKKMELLNQQNELDI